MHLKKAAAERREIGKESAGFPSSDSNPNPNFRFLHNQSEIPQLQSPNQFQPRAVVDSIPESTEYSNQSLAPIHHHLTIEIPHYSSQILISTPHKRPAIAQSQSPRALNVYRFRDKITRPNSNSTSSSSSSSCRSCASSVLSTLSSIRITTATNQFLQKLIRHALRARLICFHLRFLLILSIPPLYLFFFVINFKFFLLFILSILSLSFILFVSLNLALRHLPSIRLFLARSLPQNLNLPTSSSSKTARKGVVWSIGSKPTSEKKTNSGSWVKKYSNGDMYEGELHKGKCSGSGVYYYSMKGRYEGDWIDGKYDGYGVETWTKGSRYRGQYRQGMRHGIGVYRFYTGDVYAGEWSNGQCHGCGVYTSEDGSRFAGEFKWGVKHGLGCYHFRNGDTYAGEYFADKMHGFGVYRFANGHRYEGAWHEGRRQGLGMYTFRNGETQAGHWENSVLSLPSEQIIHPGSSFSVSQSKVLDAVQRAREAADKAGEVGKVEERVNRAVKAANRAANAARVAAIKAVQKQMMHQDQFL